MIRGDENGTALIAATLLGLIFLGMIFWFSQWGWMRGKAQVHRLASQEAFQYADSGIQTAAQHLVSPDFNQFLPALSPPLHSGATSYSLLMQDGQGRVDVSMYRNNPTDQSLVDVYATGYYFLPKGSMVDPITRQNVQMAAINAKYSAINDSQFLLAVSSGLQLDPGFTSTEGIVYGRNVIFNANISPITAGTVYCLAPQGGGSCLQYIDSGGNLQPPPLLNVTIRQQQQQLSSPPRFASLGGDNVESYYQRRLVTQPIPNFAVSGVVPAPLPPRRGYYVNGRVDIGTPGGTFTPGGVYVIYATSDVYIHSNIASSDPNCNGDVSSNPPCTHSWVGILSEGTIHIDQNAQSTIALTGNFVSNGEFVADGPPPCSPACRGSGSAVTINGGIVSLANIDLSSQYAGRTYNYQRVQGANLLLPNFINQLQYQISRGKYN